MLRLLRRELQVRSPPLPFLSPLTPLLRFLSSSSSSNSALVLDTLRGHGVPDDLCEALLSKQPKLRSMKVEANLDPKLAFLRSEGISGPEVAAILLRNPFFLLESLDRSIAPYVAVLKSLLPSRDALLRVLAFPSKCLARRLLTTVAVLREHRLPEDQIAKLLLQPRTLACSPSNFVRALEYLKELGLRPTGSIFAVAVGLLSYTSRNTFRRKVELYEELGWTEKEVLAMFKRQPSTLGLSEEVIRKKARFFRDVLGWCPELLCKCPAIMAMSLDKRILRRCAVLDVLVSQGLLGRKATSPSKFKVSEAMFVENYVKKYEETVPEVARAYEGRKEFAGWGWLREDANNQPPKLAV